MSTYRVSFDTHATVTIAVTADGPETAIDVAGDQRIPDLCGHCAGWGQSWSLDVDTEATSLIPILVTTEDGNEQWSGLTEAEQRRDEVLDTFREQVVAMLRSRGLRDAATLVDEFEL